MIRSPIQILGAIVDEVEGLRRTDARSFLPEALLREARAALADPAKAAAEASGAILGDLTDLVGRTVTHVFDSDLRRGDALILCDDNAFIVLEAEAEDGDDASIKTRTFHKALADYLRPRMLVSIGVMSAQQQAEAEKQERIAAAKRTVENARNRLLSAETVLANLTGDKQAVAT